MPLHHPKTLNPGPPTFPLTSMLFKVNSRSKINLTNYDLVSNLHANVADDGDMNNLTVIPPFVHSANATSVLGEDDEDPLFVITTMLPQLTSHDSEVTLSLTIPIPNKEPTVVHRIKSGILER